MDIYKRERQPAQPSRNYLALEMQSSGMERYYSKKEISQHNRSDDLWVIIGDTIYDVTEYQREHPGGEQGDFPAIHRNTKRTSLF